MYLLYFFLPNSLINNPQIYIILLSEMTEEFLSTVKALLLLEYQ